MPQVINTNVPSLNAQRNLNVSGQSLATTLQRLSSGLRINSAKDDAAGLAISDRFTTQIRGLNQAVRNANDGISLAQTGEGALAEITTNLQRIRELAVQSANATNSASDRAALDLEVRQRIAEVERIASQTAFNGQKILDGTFGTANFQVGANAGEVIQVDLAASVRTASIGQIALASSPQQVDERAMPAGVRVTVGGNEPITAIGSGNGQLTRQTADSAFAKAIAFGGIPGLDVQAVTNVAFNITDVVATGAAGDTYNLRINGVDIFAGLDISQNGITSKQITDAINNQTGNTGVTARLDADPNDGHPILALSASDGRNIVIGETTPNAAITGGAGAVFTTGEGFDEINGVKYFDGVIGAVADVALGRLITTYDPATGDLISSVDGNGVAYDESPATNRGYLTFSSSDNISFDVASPGGAEVYFGFQDLDGDGIVSIGRDTATLAQVSVISVMASNDAIRRVDSALTAVSNLRSTFGAIQNRFESTITNLQTTSENLSASRSRILDADFAAETAELTRTQILQQAGTAILTQANRLPQNVLQLLQG